MIQLSPSALGDFKDCPACFWISKVHGLKKPRGVFPSLPGGMDRRLKESFDAWRTQGHLPPEIRGAVPGQLFRDIGKLSRWRNWRTGLSMEIDKRITLSGALDDLLEEPDRGVHHVIDFKTRGAPPKDGDSEIYYGHQLDCYDLMLNANGLKTEGRAFLAYYWPGRVLQAAAGIADIQFVVGVKELKSDPERAKALAIAAADCIERDIPPAPSAKCEFCPHSRNRERVLESLSRPSIESATPK